MKKSLLPKFACLSLATALSFSAAQAQIVSYNFGANDEHDVSFAPTQAAANVTTTSLTRTNLYTGAGNINTAGTFEVGGDGGLTTSSTYNTNDYLSFSLTPQTGYILKFGPTAALTFTAGIQDAGTGNPAGIDVQYSTDNFATSTDLGSTSLTTSNGQAVSLSLSSLPTDFTQTAQFRFYFDGASNGYETGDIGNIVVGGAAVAAPEPSTYAFLISGLILAGLVGMRRRANV